MTTVTHTAMGYRATRTEDALVVHDVPIFCACERGDVEFDDAWVAAAVAHAKEGERGGYLPPLHIRHHEAETAMTDSVRAAGYFKVTGAKPITLRGQRRTAIFADLILTDPTAQHEVLAKRLPYRSVEIFNVDVPAIDGLALLDHEAPFLELPMLMVSEVDEQVDVDASPGFADVASATFRRPCSMDARTTDDSVLACFRRGTRATLLFREEEPMDETTDDQVTDEVDVDAEQAPAGENLAADDGDDEENDENMQDDLDVSAVVKAIESGEISVADMDAILAAIQNQKTESPTDDETVDAPAPAAAPGAEVMKKDITAQFAALAGENKVLKARLDNRDAEDERATDVRAAMKRLEGRPLGADLEAELVKFHADHGGAAFKVHVDTIAKTAGVLVEDDRGAEAFSAQRGKVPAVAMKYQDKGTDAVDRATQFCREWDSLSGSGIRTSKENYVKINMERVLAETA